MFDFTYIKNIKIGSPYIFYFGQPEGSAVERAFGSGLRS